MDMKDNGGPAFPLADDWCWSGMSLRDYFAAHAGEADIKRNQQFEWDPDEMHDGSIYVAKYTREEARFRYADAMLAARDGK